MELSHPCSDHLQHNVQAAFFFQWEKLLMKIASETFCSGSEDEMVTEINVDLQQ